MATVYHLAITYFSWSFKSDGTTARGSCFLSCFTLEMKRLHKKFLIIEIDGMKIFLKIFTGFGLNFYAGKVSTFTLSFNQNLNYRSLGQNRWWRKLLLSIMDTVCFYLIFHHYLLHALFDNIPYNHSSNIYDVYYNDWCRHSIWLWSYLWH